MKNQLLCRMSVQYQRSVLRTMLGEEIGDKADFKGRHFNSFLKNKRGISQADREGGGLAASNFFSTSNLYTNVFYIRNNLSSSH